MPKPEKHVFVCSQNRPAGHPRGCCSQKGGNDLIQAFWKELQQRQLFDQIAITYSGCLGPCDTGPNVIVYPDGVMYSQVTKDDVAAIFDEHLLGGQPVERLRCPPTIWG
jgi:(2Fe-2S) ferredoxin